MSGLLSYSGLTTKIRAMQSHLLNDQNFREIVELESVPQAVSYLKQHKGYEDLFEGYNEADLHRGQIEKMLRLTVYRDFSKLYRFANVEQRKFLALYFKRYEDIYFTISSANWQQKIFRFLKKIVFTTEKIMV